MELGPISGLLVLVMYSDVIGSYQWLNGDVLHSGPMIINSNYPASPLKLLIFWLRVLLSMGGLEEFIPKCQGFVSPLISQK